MGGRVSVVESTWLYPPPCPACGSALGAEYLVLRVYHDPDRQVGTGVGLIQVATSCIRCHHRQILPKTYSLTRRSQAFLDLRLIEELLAAETGLPVVVDPPDDPHSGVREPRTPVPSASSPGSACSPCLRLVGRGAPSGDTPTASQLVTTRTTSPAAMSAVPFRRDRAAGSLRNQRPPRVPKTTDVSRKAATNPSGASRAAESTRA